MSVSSVLRRGVAVLATVVAVVLVASESPALAAPVSAAVFTPPAPKAVTPVPVRTVAAGRLYGAGTDPAAVAAARTRPAAVWPTPGTSDVDLPAAGAVAAAAPGAVRAGGLPVYLSGATQPDPWPAAADVPAAAGTRRAAVTGPAKVRVQLLDRAATDAAGVRGVLLRVGRVDSGTGAGRVAMSVDYRGFASAYGADWSTRLRLEVLPACALTTPDRAECRGVVLPSHNDVAAGRVSADVMLPGAASSTVVALAAGASGAAGSYAATSLSASSTWSAGGSSGDFSWSYPMRSPPAAGGPVPTVELSYSSQSVDGRMAASNNQPSVIGEGFELATGGFIERRYKGCGDDMTGANNTVKTGDQCWATDNATLNLNGHSSELLKDAVNPNLWHPRSDDASKVEHLTGAVNGDNDGEWWVVTTNNGTQYWFGRNRLPGWTSGTTTNSTWTEPVAGNNTGEPCHAATFAGSFCDQAWRWNLDYVVDPHNNTMSLWYTAETNYYARNLVTATPVVFTRGGYLSRVDYGSRVEPNLATGADTTFTGHPAARVVYGFADRCLSGCATHDATHWPDTPWDLNCTAGTSCANTSPTFWTNQRLSTVTTQVWDGTTSAYRDVERWTLTHTFPDPGDTTRAGLWLSKISHVGLVGGSTPTPDVVFTGIQLNNRVDTIDHSPAMNWWRMSAIDNDTGGRISVGYSAPDCIAGTRVPAAPESNTLRCYPVKWTPEGLSGPVTDYFHKYVVNTVTETDLTGGAPRVLHTYTYLGDPAWHYTDDDGLVAADQKTWSQWRGYAKVGVSNGDPGEQTYTESLYLRGMNGDHLPSGARSVTVTDSQGGTITDDDAFAGVTREERTFNGPGGAEVSGVINDPWQSAATATRTIAGVTVTSRYLNTQATHARTTLDGGRPAQRTSTRNTFDAYGMVVRADDFGDDTTAADDKCTVTTYEPRNTTAWLMSYPQRVQGFAANCDQVASGPITAANILGDGRTSYDGNGWGNAPVRGDVTRTETLTAWSATAPTYLTVSRSAFDAQGRATETWDILGNHTSTAFTPATGGPVTQVADTNPRGWTTSTVYDPAWGLATSTVDVNGRHTDLAYDGLGRLTGVWMPGRVKGTDPASVVYAYRLRVDGAVAVTTKSLNPAGAYVTSYELYDGLLRPRQSQSPSPAGGRLLTDTFYDAAGRGVKTFSSYYATGVPGEDLVTPVDIVTVPSQTRTVYDGAGRTTASIFQPYNVERWRTTTAYGGDRTDVTPPAGGTATSTVSDARGRTTELRQYHGTAPTPYTAGSYDTTTYSYDAEGRLSRVTDPLATHWDYGYDLRGRQTSTTDPDLGPTTSTYDNAGRLTSTTDARGITLAYGYDDLSRKTGVYLNSTSGTRLAGWTYDATPLGDGSTVAKGKPSSSTRYVGTDAYTVSTVGYTDRYEPTGTTISIPTAENGLSGDYTFLTGYNVDGSVNSVVYPPTGDLTLEAIGLGYTDLSQPLTLNSFYGTTLSSYVSDTQYNALGEATQYTMYRGSGPKAYETRVHELETGRLTQLTTQISTGTSNNVSDLHYTYDNDGTLTKIADTPAGATADTQCFNEDYLGRLTTAWTPASGNCATAPTPAGLGGPAPYWQSWTYDLVGRRLTQTDHATAVGDRTTTNSYPTSLTAQPHTLSGTSTVDSTGTRTASYTYDALGNTTRRPAPTTGNQVLTWDAEGHLASATDTSGSSSYLYDADGNRLISRDPTGKTLFLPGSELRYTNATAALTCTRYYDFGGAPVAQRTATAVSWLSGDHQNTQQVAIDATTQAVTRRRQTPFGAARGTGVTWPNDKGFVGGTVDQTGLTHLGAREYDPAIGRFISGDPVFDSGDPQQFQSYAYAENSPVAHSDPSGERTDDLYYGPSGAATMNKEVTNVTLDPTPTPKPKKKKKCNFICQAHNKWDQTVNWVDDHKAQIAGIAAGIGAGLACEVMTGGAGSLGCLAVGSAVGNLVTDAVGGKIHSLGDAVNSFATGGITGLLSPILVPLDAISQTAGAIKDAKNGNWTGAAGHAGMLGLDILAMRGGGGKGGGKVSCHSFAPATTVLMADGSTKPIQDVNIGDQVTSTDPTTGETVTEAVTALHRNTDSDLVDITVQTGDGRQATIHTTQHHPFWDLTLGYWVDAVDLQVGAALATADDSLLIVLAVVKVAGSREMRDLTVAASHTYYAVAAETAVLVHNNSCPVNGHSPVGIPGTNPNRCTCPKPSGTGRENGANHGAPEQATRAQSHRDDLAHQAVVRDATGKGVNQELKALQHPVGTGFEGPVIILLAAWGKAKNWWAQRRGK